VPDDGGGRSWEHRKAVNALVAVLKAAGKVEPSLAAAYASEDTVPTAVATLPVAAVAITADILALFQANPNNT
jgi:hypothetical protein